MDSHIPDLAQRVEARRAAGLDKYDHPPVVVRPGGAAPTLLGQRWHYETKGGTWIAYPHAYGKVGWSNMMYRPSSRRVEVGVEWLRGTGNRVTITDAEVGVAA